MSTNQVARVGKLVDLNTGNTIDLSSITTSPATTSAYGLVKKAVAVPNSTATDVAGLVTNFNSLLAALRTSGVLTA